MNPKIIVSSTNMLIDENLNLQIIGLKPNQQIKIKAEMKDDMERTWSSFAIFTANNEEKIDLNKTSPEKGSYTGCYSNGLLWSMKLKEKNTSLPSIFLKNSVRPHKVTFYLVLEDEIIDKKEIEINFINSNIKQINIEKPVVGKLFTNEEKDTLPAIIVVGGSTGGMFWTEQVAALLSTKGYSTFALNYFDSQNNKLPDELFEIQLEYFEKALSWLKKQPQIDKNNISMMGISKGGELSLVLGSYFSDKLTSIVSYVPSSHVFEGISMGKHPRKSSWTYKNKAIDFIQFSEDSIFSMDMNPLNIKKIHDEALAKATGKELRNARIQIENINCPILMISGEKDTTWSSSKMCSDMMKTIEEHNNPHQSQHINFKNMGHTFFLPNIPPIIDHPSVTAQNAANANKSAWESTLKFLSKHFN
ncbi:acyl-CoA thioesterase/BAAT N-terminal domain-containing protein [Clostridium sp. D2Q-14]|uniref:acyl-CoA thioesterase/bile acid-CoA:amino acid N-acyltransferase family protein n=1 Tax=Anaeromonas gelatinilytica TaxID=2683194 RepID=UPI00193BBC27|nr:acyl-CoA thioesterase/bile acid-CoA:amino acid N-acyltransferase family protein [Anaeromonas gelatinilytica]MBS4534279.1 acyl-CoA thioesterase/BAAT N-terminal domain-containing protein [Anaeromonas gelatinilytica]